MHTKPKRPEPPPEPELDKLPEKWQLFVMEYQKDFNATRAAMAAGYSKRTAYSIGWELLRKPDIQAANQRYRESMTGELGLSVQRVVLEYMKIAFADPGDIIDFGVSNEIRMDSEGQPILHPETYEPLTYKSQFVTLRNSDEIDGSLISEIKQGKDGVSIKLHDKMKALEALTRYMDVLPDHHRRMIEEKKLELQREQVAIAKTKANGDDPPGAQDDGFFDALKASAKEVWADEIEAGDVPLETVFDETD
ncbi:terminase small subunit [Paenibacillus agricola]|uniref:terminase small subunit n=1 Tax=Paenibacillus agricola TaxID=2716264 RepID=UPI001A9FD34C|nr:terminase small subunit [Paenibacillus agricola]